MESMVLFKHMLQPTEERRHKPNKDKKLHWRHSTKTRWLQLQHLGSTTWGNCQSLYSRTNGWVRYWVTIVIKKGFLPLTIFLSSGFMTRYGVACLDGHPCDTYGENYYWCRSDFYFDEWYLKLLDLDWITFAELAPGSWSGITALMTDITQYTERCVTPTFFLHQLSKGNNVMEFWIMFLSTINFFFQSCYNDVCSLGGESYNWCYTDSEKNWDYCSPRYILKGSFKLQQKVSLIFISF